MSRIDELNARLAPNGVRFASLGQIATYRTGEQLNRTTMSEGAAYPVINGGIGPSGKHDSFNTEANTITVSQGGASAGYVNFVTERFWAGAHCYIVQPTTLAAIDTRFLYFVMKNGQSALQASKLGAGIPGLSVSGLSSFLVPVPPLEVQHEIVRILDTFMDLEAELEAELEARRLQYLFHRDQLLTFPEGDAVAWVTLPEVAANLDSRRRPVTKAAREGGEFPYYGASGRVDYVRDFIFDGDYLLVSEDGANLLTRSMPIAFSISGKTWVNNHAHILEFPSYAERRFVEFYLNSIDLSPYVSGGAQPKLNQFNLNRIPLPWPAREEQQRIVNILDKFEALVSDLDIGLPAELNARGRQYEYYRDKLLTFKKAAG